MSNESLSWLLVYEGTLNLRDRGEILVHQELSSPQLAYEAVFNYNINRVGNLIHRENLFGLGLSVIDRYPVFRGKNFLQLAPSVATEYQLAFAPSFEPLSLLTVHLKIWTPSMPLSRFTGSVSVIPSTSATATALSVASTVESTTILAANPDRKGATIWNASTAMLYLDLDSGENAVASANDFTVCLSSGDYYEIPYGYTGEVVGVWSAANGNALVREFE
jgi:hypothetical protein